jgi:hypothetical protein
MLTKIGIHATSQEVDLHQQICTARFEASDRFLRAADEWFCRLKKANDVSRVFGEPYFSMALVDRWFALCYGTLSAKRLRPGIYFGARILKVAAVRRGFVPWYVTRNIYNFVSDEVHNRLLGRAS